MCSGASVKVDEISIGAKINKIFHERLPLKLAERQIDEKNLRREIKIVIQNIRGVRSGLFTPDMAFERIVKEQIQQMQQAPTLITEQVVSLLIEAVREATNSMSQYPALREEVDRIVRKGTKIITYKMVYIIYKYTYRVFLVDFCYHQFFYLYIS